MNCSACGADSRDGARFCHSCGQRLIEVQVPVSADMGKREEDTVEGEEAVPKPAEGVEEELAVDVSSAGGVPGSRGSMLLP